MFEYVPDVGALENQEWLLVFLVVCFMCQQFCVESIFRTVQQFPPVSTEVVVVIQPYRYKSESSSRVRPVCQGGVVVAENAET